jgi:hypothetical protein
MAVLFHRFSSMAMFNSFSCYTQIKRSRTTDTDFGIRKKYDIVISSSDAQLSKTIKNYLQRNSYSVFILNECDDTRKEKFILKCTCIISCLNDDYKQHQLELIFAYKNQVQIIPIIINNRIKYRPNDHFVRFIAERHSTPSIFINLENFNPAMVLLVNKIERLRFSQVHTPFCYPNSPISSKRSHPQGSVSVILSETIYVYIVCLFFL